MPVEPGEWERIVAENPDHSRWYIQRFRDLAAAGDDIVGEARMIDAMVPRRSRILDAGCGPGRIGGFLHALGHDVVGVDVDPVLIAAAQEDYPGPRWLVGNLAELDLSGPEHSSAATAHTRTEHDSAEGELPAAGFDVIVCAGNVVTFIAPSTRRDVLRGFERHLRVDGRAVVGFGAGRDYAYDDFFADAEAVGLTPDLLLSTWDLRPFTPTSSFLVAILRRS